MKTWGNKRKKTLNLNWFLSRRLPPSLGKNQKWPSPTFAKKNQKHRGRPLLFENNRGHLPPFGLGKAKERTKAAPIFSFSHTSRPPSPFWPWKSKRENQGSPYFLLLTYQPATFPLLALEKQKREPRQPLFSPSHIPAGRPWHFEGGSQDQEPRPSLSFPVGAGHPPLIWQQKTREPKEPQPPLLPLFLWFSPQTSQSPPSYPFQ